MYSDPNALSSGGFMAALGGFFLIFFLIEIALIAVGIWSYGTLLKAATGQSKAMALLLLIPFLNFVMIIVWGVQAHNILKEKESSGGS